MSFTFYFTIKITPNNPIKKEPTPQEIATTEAKIGKEEKEEKENAEIGKENAEIEKEEKEKKEEKEEKEKKENIKIQAAN